MISTWSQDDVAVTGFINHTHHHRSPPADYYYVVGPYKMFPTSHGFTNQQPALFSKQWDGVLRWRPFTDIRTMSYPAHEIL